VAVANLTSPAQAQLAPTPSPLEYCPFHVAVVEGLDREPQVSQNYAVALESEFAQGNASGTLVFYAGNDRYEASFENVAASVRGESVNEATPVVVHLPSAVHVDGAYVASVEAPIAGYCTPGNVWLPEEVGMDATVLHFDPARFRKAAARVQSITATLAQRESAPNCDHPNVAAHLQSQATFDVAALAQELQKDASAPAVAVAVALAPSGVIAATKVIVSNGNHALEEHAVHEALQTSYVAEHFRCQPVTSTYIFTSTGH
jgi:hypothetical protein